MENENNIKIKIGARIRFLRTELGLTQEQLANKLTNVKGKSSIANYENGSNLPSDEVKLKMCEIFNCSLDYLMCKSDVRNPEKVNINDADVAFASGVKALNETNKMIIKNTLEALLAKQEQDNKNTEDK
jgi:transcriptional regulator with XRE-family HTH domain